MKLFIKKILIFIFCLFCIDQCCGLMLDFGLSQSSDEKSMGRKNYIIHKTKEDILIFGSSRAAHHYIPAIIADSLNMTCYNCGLDGIGVYFVSTVIKTILERYHPKYIIYDIYPKYDFFQTKNENYLAGFKGFYGTSKHIDSMVCAVDDKQYIKNISKLYQYNSVVTSPIIGYFTRKKKNSYLGFLPYEGIYEGAASSQEFEMVQELNETKIRLLKQLCMLCHNKTKLIFVTSPFFIRDDYKRYEPVINLAKEFDIPFIYNGDDENFIGNRNLFVHINHLNHEGAIEYSKKMASKIKELIAEE